MDINTLVKLTSRAWSLNILAAMHTGVAGRQAALLSATQASRTAFSASLEHLVTLGLLERNPGHGHPLRPEFRLTAPGTQAAEIASCIVSAVTNEAEFGLVRRSWTVPILALTAKPQRFSSMKTSLNPITDRALSSSLHTLEERDWIHRDINTSARAPYPTYSAANTGIKINRAVGLLL